MASVLAFQKRNLDLQHHVRWLQQRGAPVREVMAQSIAKITGHRPAQVIRKIQRVAVLNLFFAEFLHLHQRKGSWKTLGSAPFGRRDLQLFEAAILHSSNAWDYKTALRKSFRSLKGGDWTVLARVGRPIEFESFVTKNTAFIGRRLYERFDLSHRAAAHSAVKYLRKTAIGMFLRDAADRAKEDPTSLISYIERSRRVSQRVRVAALISYMPQALSEADIAYVRDKHGWEIEANGRYLIQTVAEFLGFKSRDVLYACFYKLRNAARKAGGREARGSREACSEIVF